jgi:hypothetical protein
MAKDREEDNNGNGKLKRKVHASFSSSKVVMVLAKVERSARSRNGSARVYFVLLPYQPPQTAKRPRCTCSATWNTSRRRVRS